VASQTGDPRKGGHARENLAENRQNLDSEEVRIGPLPLMKEIPLENSDLPDQPSNTPDYTPQVMDTPTSERADPAYYPPESPKSRRELQTTRTEPIMTVPGLEPHHKNQQNI